MTSRSATRTKGGVGLLIVRLKKKIGKMQTQHGPRVTYLEINPDYSEKEKVKLEMINYLREIVKDFKGDFRNWKTPAGHDLYLIDQEAPELEKDQK